MWPTRYSETSARRVLTSQARPGSAHCNARGGKTRRFYTIRYIKPMQPYAVIPGRGLRRKRLAQRANPPRAGGECALERPRQRQGRYRARKNRLPSFPEGSFLDRTPGDPTMH